MHTQPVGFFSTKLKRSGREADHNRTFTIQFKNQLMSNLSIPCVLIEEEDVHPER